MFKLSCSTVPCRIIGWLCSFNIWYQIFVSAHLSFLSSLPEPFHIVILLLWNLIWYLTIVSLLSSAFTDPPPINERYNMPQEFLEVSTEVRSKSFFKQLSRYAFGHPEIEFQLTDHSSQEFVYPRYCFTCKIFKPPRTHHCRSCDRCIPRMDHHCPVIGTCVHTHNHKFFLNYLFWASILCVYATVLITSTTVTAVGTDPNFLLDMSPFDLIVWVIAVSGWTNAIICAVALFIFQVYLWLMLIKNETTLESHDTRDKPDFSLGSWTKNVDSVFGYNRILWFIPIQTSPSDGFTFPSIPPNDDFNQMCNLDDDDDEEDDDDFSSVADSDNEIVHVKV